MQAVRQFNQSVHGVGTLLHKLNDPRYHWVTRPLAAFLITRAIVFFAAYIAEIAIPGISGDGLYHVNPSNVWLDVWARWDSGFYLRIAEEGYRFVIGQQSSVAFFPVYPLSMNLLAPFAGSNLAAGVLVSNVYLFFGLIFLYRLTETIFKDSGTATRAVFYIAAFPTAFFFSAVYTESTFLLFSTATAYFARKHQWGWAAVTGILCSASRIVGFLVAGLVIYEWLMAHGWTLATIYKKQAWANLWDGIRKDWPQLLIIALIPLGMVSYMVFLWRTFGDPLAFNTTQSAWGRQMLGPVAIVLRDLGGLLRQNFLTGEIWYHVLLDLGAFFAVLFTTWAIWRRMGAGYGIYVLLAILIPMSSGSGSLTRYVLVIFPFFMMLAHWGRHTVLDRALLVGFSVFLGIFTTIFVNWIFIG
ncbi:MAG: hypothetical protein IPK17_02320 [Chloroflexi bacterium]|uniref:mannosyltransferase family protein n=1 Tax=Candidatus Flexifilum breve TaxID=3140694 RepID=UPI003135BDD7|nr:hypothetical protein [Chloroflexota bacterium]